MNKKDLKSNSMKKKYFQTCTCFDSLNGFEVRAKNKMFVILAAKKIVNR